MFYYTNKNPNPGKKNIFLEGGGGWVGGGEGVGGWGGGGGEGRGGRYGQYEHESCHIFYTQHFVMTSSAEPCRFMITILTVFKTESTAA